MARTYSFEPQGIIYVYRHVPLDNTYQHTLHFKTRADQLRYFNIDPHAPVTSSNEFMKLEFNGQTVTRNERKIIRVDHNYADLMDCNYIAYLNKPFASPNPANNLGIWVFAFIISVEYINDYVTEIEFEIDVMQTFMWNYALRECFVEREHSLTDNIGDSLTPEPINADIDYKTAKIDNTGFFNDYAVLAVTSFEPEDVSDIKQAANYMYGGLITGGVTWYRDASDLQTSLRSWEQMNLIDGINALYFVPRHFLEGGKIYEHAAGDEIVSTTKPTTINGYTPKNKKLFTYPYTYLTVDTYEMQHMYRPEFFPVGDSVDFHLYFSMQAIPQIMVVPDRYENFSENILNSCVMVKFLPISYRYSQYRTWWAETAEKLGVNIALSAAHLMGGDVGKLKALTGFENEITNLANEYASAKVLPPAQRGETAGAIETAARKKDVFFVWTQLTPESASIIDSFFTMYGYNTQKVKIPNIVNYDTCRPSFNYIKCSNISLDWELRPDGASVPDKYMKKIISIYNKGITFWKNPNRVGRYFDNNAPS